MHQIAPYLHSSTPSADLRSHRLLAASLVASSLALSACNQEVLSDRPTFAATIHPLASILRELAGDRADVITLIPPGASPHTYAPRPSDVRATNASLVLFYVDDELDGWAAKLAAPKTVCIRDTFPEAFQASAADPHFWSDPTATQAIVGPLTDMLVTADPEGAEVYRRNALSFDAKLGALEKQLKSIMEPHAGKAVVVFHPSWERFLDRYGITIAAMIEPSPGKEPTPRHIQSVIEAAQLHNAKLILTEAQLPHRPAEVIADATGLPIVELDPLGGAPGRQTYAELLRYNAERIAQALQ